MFENRPVVEELWSCAGSARPPFGSNHVAVGGRSSASSDSSGFARTHFATPQSRKSRRFKNTRTTGLSRPAKAGACMAISPLNLVSLSEPPALQAMRGTSESGLYSITRIKTAIAKKVLTAVRGNQCRATNRNRECGRRSCCTNCELAL